MRPRLRRIAVNHSSNAGGMLGCVMPARARERRAHQSSALAASISRPRLRRHLIETAEGEGKEEGYGEETSETELTSVGVATS